MSSSSFSNSDGHVKPDTPPVISDTSTHGGRQSEFQERQPQAPPQTGEKVTPANEAETTTEDDVRKITGFRWFLICAALYVSALIYGLDTTIAADIQGAVVQTFDNASQLAWIGAGFPLGSVAVILPYGFLFTKFNMKWLYIGGIVLFQAGSALCGGAPTMNALIVGRVFAGIGGTGIYLGGLNCFSALTTRQERGAYLTGTGFVWGIGAILGPIVGGSFADSSATWRWGFYLNLVIGAVTAPVYLFYLPAIHPAGTGTPVRQRLLTLDYLGFVLSAGMWVAFTLGFISAGTIWDWNDGRTIATIVVSGVLAFLYALQQYFCILTTPEMRSFPGHLLKSRTQILLFIATTSANVGLFFTTFYIPIYFQFTRSDTSLEAAVRLLPYLLFTISVNLATGWALPKIKYYMPLCLFSGILMTAASASFLGILSPDTPTSQIYGLSVLMGFGTGITMQLGYAVGSLKVPASDVFSAINLQNTAQIGATVITLVIASQAFQSNAIHNLNKILAGLGYSQAEIHNAVAGAQSTLFADLSEDLRVKAIGGITSAIRISFVIPLVAGITNLLSALFMRREKLFS